MGISGLSLLQPSNLKPCRIGSVAVHVICQPFHNIKLDSGVVLSKTIYSHSVATEKIGISISLNKTVSCDDSDDVPSNW